ncbi:MAG TPA: phosphopentomutase [Tissierellia bacterium]|jgi:phosphopentomutase|nr:phosphopentomutase [Tissierellia bacterium]
MKRAIVIILDSLGIGHAPDAAEFSDEGANTLGTILKAFPDIHIPHLKSLGFLNIEGVDAEGVTSPKGVYGRLYSVSKGKDTTIGHWELMGLQVDQPLPTYPEGFPDEVIKPFIEQTGRGVLCNKPYSGTEVIKEYAKEQKETGKWIVYTSNDSVFQIAAHEEWIPLEELYRACKIARKILTDEHAVARVIARPYVGTFGDFVRTANRRDFSLDPFSSTVLDHLKEEGKEVIGIGKIEDIFNGAGITRAIHTKNNEDGMHQTIQLVKEDVEGLLFTNLVDFDAMYGHRRNIEGYKNAIEAFDVQLGELLDVLRPDDLLILTADHGNDPGFRGTDHTREMVPVVIYQKDLTPASFGTKVGFYHIGQTVADHLGVKGTGLGETLLR